MAVYDLVRDLILDTTYDILDGGTPIIEVLWITDVPDNIVTDGGDQIVFREEE